MVARQINKPTYFYSWGERWPLVVEGRSCRLFVDGKLVLTEPVLKFGGLGYFETSNAYYYPKEPLQHD